MVLARNYPNNVLDMLGLWVERMVQQSTRYCEPTVISPVPYCPPFPGLPENFRQYRRIVHRRTISGVEARYPRMFVGPRDSLFRFAWRSYTRAVEEALRQKQALAPFDLIHAHFSYPDGVAAVRLGQKWNVPVAITEHVPWNVWAAHPAVLNRAAWAARHCALHISVSQSVLRSVQAVVGKCGNQVVLPNAVDGSLFRISGRKRIPNQILFAGAVRPVKGLDVLVHAIRQLREEGRDVQLVVAGEAYYGQYRLEQARIEKMVGELRLTDRVVFAGKKMPADLALLMEESAVLVLPSRMESFGLVLVEALACGTPVVSTESGGPADIVTGDVGTIVPIEDPVALAAAIARILDEPDRFEPGRLREYALRRFGIEPVSVQLASLYQDALKSFQAPEGPVAA